MGLAVREKRSQIRMEDLPGHSKRFFKGKEVLFCLPLWTGNRDLFREELILNDRRNLGSSVELPT